MSNEKAFRDWMAQEPQQYDKGTIDVYVSALRNVEKWSGVELRKPLLDVDAADELMGMMRVVEGVENFKKLNDDHSHGRFTQAANLYKKYLISLQEKVGNPDDSGGDRGSGGNAAVGDKDVSTVRYWLYAPGHDASKWEQFHKGGVMGIGWSKIGDLTQYASLDAMKAAMKENYGQDKSYKNDALATWQFAHEIKPGDVIFVKKGMRKLVGRGTVIDGYRYDADIADDYKHLRRVKWTDKGTWDYPGIGAVKTLTDITWDTDTVEKLNSLFSDAVIIDPPPPEYTKDDFLSEVYMSEEDYETLVAVLAKKKNVILQGAPGVGKTFTAKRLAYSIMGKKDAGRVQMVQFHQSYSYEDFIEGYRPAITDDDKKRADFIIKKGVFYNFCKKAAGDSENTYFFIIDEINRGNLSKIFGELFMLIENDKRGAELQLLYSDEKFSVPENVFVIGMMNTADRSLAMLDYALRRRFAFHEMKPGFETDGFKAYQKGRANDKFDRLVECVKRLNRSIAEDTALGEGFCIGHSYFCNLKPGKVTDAELHSIVDYELIPLLKEYWFDEPEKVRDWQETLRNAIR